MCKPVFQGLTVSLFAPFLATQNPLSDTIADGRATLAVHCNGVVNLTNSGLCSRALDWSNTEPDKTSWDRLLDHSTPVVRFDVWISPGVYGVYHHNGAWGWGCCQVVKVEKALEALRMRLQVRSGSAWQRRAAVFILSICNRNKLLR